jgi:DNA-binding GntR family transcriptional regulator
VVVRSQQAEARADKRIYVESLSTKIADVLRDSILTGELRQGEAITQDGIARQHAVSTMPVREALLMLSHEGVIEARPNRGFRVARMARQDVEDIYWAHGVLAARLTAKACERLSDDALLELQENTKKLTEASKADASDVVESLNWQFHRIINNAADSPKILALLKITVKQIPARFYAVLPDWARLTARDHKELMVALRNRDADEAARLAAEHVAGAGSLVVEYFESQGYWGDPPG